MVVFSQAVYAEGKYKCSENRQVYPDPRSMDQFKRGEWELRCLKCGGMIKVQPTDESRVNPANSFGISKYSQELISLTLGKGYTNHLPEVFNRARSKTVSL